MHESAAMDGHAEQLRIPGYDVGAPIGTGGMGHVLAGVRHTDGHPVAIKIPRRDIPRATAAFRTEIELTRALSHDGIVRVLGWSSGATTTWMAMERLEGRGLQELMTSDVLGVDERVDILLQLARTLAYVHEQGILHLDVKPQNVVVSADLRTRMFDFGISRWIEHQPKTNIISGSPRYMSPEQASGAVLDGRADVFSLGVLAYELLTGRPPWDSEKPAEVPLRAVLQPPARLRDLIGIEDRLDAGQRRIEILDQAVHGALEPDPGDRLPSAEELARALAAAWAPPSARIVTSSSASERAPGRAWPRGRATTISLSRFPTLPRVATQRTHVASHA